MKKRLLFSNLFPSIAIVTIFILSACSKDKEFSILEANYELTRLNCCDLGFSKLGSEFVYKIKVQLPDNVSVETVFADWSAHPVSGNTGTYFDNGFTMTNNTIDSYSYWVFGADDSIVNNLTIVTSDDQSKTVSITIQRPAGAN